MGTSTAPVKAKVAWSALLAGLLTVITAALVQHVDTTAAQQIPVGWRCTPVGNCSCYTDHPVGTVKP